MAMVTLVSASGCLNRVPDPPPKPQPTAESEWPAAYAQAMSEVRESRLGIADRVLTDYAQRFPGSPEAAEVAYWRALFKLDPSNAAATRDAIGLLDSYLATTPNGTHRLEATTLRRLVAALDARDKALATAQAAIQQPKPEDKAREEELVRLRDDLAKANAELSRIKRRLARPKP
jgi:TolA-binding protein